MPSAWHFAAQPSFEWELINCFGKKMKEVFEDLFHLKYDKKKLVHASEFYIFDRNTVFHIVTT